MNKNKTAETLYTTFQTIKVTCKSCGHNNTMPAYVDKSLCWYCKRTLVNNTKAHFIYKLRKGMIENEGKVIKRNK